VTPPPIITALRWRKVCWSGADIPKLRSLELTLTVDGTVRQKDSTSNLVYRPAETLSELSRIQDLHTGDLLSTGTPSGCALSIPSAEKLRAVAALPEDAKWKAFLDIQAARTQYLKAGDILESHIASPDGLIDLGMQRNHVVDQAI
jgi:2,4-didehydro-3-deoxy-L-rhamnonate hydrolase